MRRFILTYTENGHSLDIEGVQFSSERVALEYNPDGGVASYRDIARMDYELNEFGETSIKWIDKEVSSV